MPLPAIIVGASHAGVAAAGALRKQGFAEPIYLFGSERFIPYHRPPLSKAYLQGSKGADEIILKAGSYYASEGIDLRLGESVDAIDLAAQSVSVGGTPLHYGKLILATGAAARPAPFPHEFNGVFVLRDMADADALRGALEGANDLVLIGGGFIGLEVAATAAAAGKMVTVVEAQPRLLTRSVPEPLAEALRRRHEASGVVFRFGETVAAIEASNDQATGVRLQSGEVIPSDVVVIGIGSVPRSALGAAAGLDTAAGGLATDAFGRTNAPDVFAVGDVATVLTDSGPERLESVQNANDRARAVAALCVDAAPPATPVPWFWTDQYDWKVQMAGLSRPGTDIVVRGDPDSGAFSLLEFDGDRLIAAHSVNAGGDHMAARGHVGSGAALDRALAADPSVKLRDARAVANETPKSSATL